MSESLLPKKHESSSTCSGKTLYGGLLFTALAGVLVVYSITGLNENTSRGGDVNSILRVIDGEVNVKHLSPMKKEWLHFNDITLQMETLSPYMMEGKLLKEKSETTFKVNAVDKVFTVSGAEESFYSSKSALSDEVVYQFTNKEGKSN